MADDDLNLDTGDIEKDSDAKASKNISKRTLIISLVSFGVIIIGASSWYLLGTDSKVAKQTIQESQVKNNIPATYESFAADFVVNLKDDKGDNHNLVIAVSIMTRDSKTHQAIKQHKPLLSNGLLELFAEQSYSTMLTMKGKKSLRKKSLIEATRLLGTQSKHNEIEAVLFTKYMME
jgi:flagellar basal body-associated protein FliL